MPDYRNPLVAVLTRILAHPIEIECVSPNDGVPAPSGAVHFHHCPELRFMLPPVGAAGFVRATLFPSFVRHTPIGGEALSRCISLWLEPQTVHCNFHGMTQAIAIPASQVEQLGLTLDAATRWLDRYADSQRIYGKHIFQLHLNHLLQALCSAITIALSDFEIGGGATLPDQVRNLIRLRYSDPDFSVADIAETLKLNPNYLSGLFHRECGETIRAALIRFRLEQAVAMMRTRRHLIKEIAHACGFRNQYYFSAASRRRFHETPRAYSRTIAVSPASDDAARAGQ